MFRLDSTRWVFSIIDIGPEFRLQSISAGINQIDAVLITHEHMDHNIAGIDDLRMYTFLKNIQKILQKKFKNTTPQYPRWWH